MIFKKWNEDAEQKLQSATNTELLAIANGTEPDAAKIADNILLGRMNRYIEKRVEDAKPKVGFTEEDFQ